MKTLELTRKTLLIISLLCAAPLAAQANLVTNPGFETGNFSGWTLIDPSGFSNVGSDPAFAHSGTYHANLGTRPVPPGPANTASLSQTLGIDPGSLYNLSFWLANDVTLGLSPTSTFRVLFGGVQIFALTPNSAPFPYTFFRSTISHLPVLRRRWNSFISTITISSDWMMLPLTFLSRFLLCGLHCRFLARSDSCASESGGRKLGRELE